MNRTIDYEQLTQLLVKTLREKQSQESLSIDLQANFNIVSRWETGQRGFYWQDFILLSNFKNINVAQALLEVTHFSFSKSPDSQELLAQLITSSAKEVLKDNFSLQKINRLATGKSKLLFTEFLWMIDVLYGRVERFVYKILEGLNTTEIDNFFGLSNEKRGLLSDPFYALLRLSLSLEIYKNLPEHSDEILANFLRASPAEVKEGIRLLSEVNAIEKKGKHYIYNEQYLDTGARGKEDSRQFVNSVRKQIIQAAQDIEKPTPGLLTAYMIYPSSKELDERVFEVCRKFYIDIKNLIAAAPDQGHDRLQYMGVELFRMDPSRDQG